MCFDYCSYQCLCPGYDIDGVAAPKKLTKAEREEARVKAAGKTLVYKIQSPHVLILSI